MVKNLFQHINHHYISLIIICIIIIFAYGNYRCFVGDEEKQKKDPFLIFDGPPLFKSDNMHFQVDRWSFTHVGFFAIF